MMRNIKFFETICIKDGQLINADMHNERIIKTLNKFFPQRLHFNINIKQFVRLPSYLNKEQLVKCRFIYDADSIDIEYEKYLYRDIRTLRLVEANIEYDYKYYNRDCFKELKERYREDEIIIVKGGFITDTTFSNLVFEKGNRLYTPATYLLNGIMRQNLLKKGIICEAKITKDNIYTFDAIILINAMNNIDTLYKIPINHDTIIM